MLSPLAAENRSDGQPLCQILIAGRDEAHLRPLIDTAAAAGGLIDLNAIPRRQLRPALNAYVKDLLGHATPYERLPFAPAADVLAEAIASALTAGPGTDVDPAPQEWGEFLVAGLYVRYVLDLPPVQEPAEARELGEAVPRDLRSVLTLDLARPAPGLDMMVLRAAARALAFAEGSGMPERVIGHAGAALMPSPGYPAGLSGRQVRMALDRLRFYLRREVDLDGSTLCRLFHQGLADQLRADASQDDTAVTGSGPAARVWQHLYALIPADLDGARQWQHAELYLLRHAAQHAAAANQLEDLLQDTGFLIHADPISLAPLLAALPAGAADGAADTYRASYASHSRQPPEARAQILAVDAARYGYLDLARRLSAAAFWQPVWATSQSRSARLRLTITGHTSAVKAVALARAGDREVIVSRSDDGTTRIWDAETGQPAGPPLTGHTSIVRAMAAGRAGDRDVIVSGGEDGKVRVWDAIAGLPVGPPLIGDDRAVVAVAVGRAGDCDVVVSGGADGTVRIWNAVTRRPTCPPLTGHTSWVGAVAVGRVGDRDVIVSGSDDKTVRVWDAVTGQPASSPLAGHTDSVHSVAAGRAGDRDVIVSGGRDRTVRVWDAVTGELVSPPLTGHTDWVYTVAVGRADGRDVIVSGSGDGTVRVWDAVTGQPTGPPLIGHTRGVHAVAAALAGDRDVIVSGGEDLTMRVWNPVTGQPVGLPLFGQFGWVVAVAVGRIGDRDVIVSGSADDTVQIWDAVTGEPVGPPLTGHTNRVKAVAVGRVGDRDVIVSGSNDDTVRVWDAVTGEPVGPPLTGHTHSVEAVAVGRVGDLEVLVSGSLDGTVRVWDAITGQQVVQQQFPDEIWSLALVGETLAMAQGNDVVVLRANPAIAPVTGLSSSQQSAS